MTVLDRDRYSMSQAAQRVGVHPATVWRWALRGVRGRRLRTVLIGGRRYVLRDDLEAFLDGDGAADRPDDRERRTEIAEQQLDAMGVGRRDASSAGRGPMSMRNRRA